MDLDSLSTSEAQSFIYYYIREGLWRRVIHLCSTFFDRYGDPFFVFWGAFAHYKEGNPSQAVNELQKIESKTELIWATTKASIYYHEKCQTIDYRTVDSLKMMETDFSRKASERAVVAAAMFNMFINEPLFAKDILAATHYDSPITLVAKAWLEIMLNENGGLVSSKTPQERDQKNQIYLEFSQVTQK